MQYYHWLSHCQGSVVCVICSCLLCPYLVCFCPCFMSLWVKYVPAVFMWLCVNYPVYISPVFWVWFRLVYSLLPGVSCLSALSCLALMSTLNTIIWVYILVCVFLFLPRVCTMTLTYYHSHAAFLSGFITAVPFIVRTDSIRTLQSNIAL